MTTVSPKPAAPPKRFQADRGCVSTAETSQPEVRDVNSGQARALPGSQPHSPKMPVHETTTQPAVSRELATRRSAERDQWPDPTRNDSPCTPRGERLRPGLACRS